MATFDSTKTRLATVLDDIMSGKIQLPDFQRGWVWDDEHIRSLLVSIARAFPIGAVMLLETGGDARFKVRPVEGVTGLHPATSADLAEKLILDGQQRLTSLTQVLKMHTPVLTKDPKKRVLRRHYYIDIDMALSGPEHYDEAVIGVDEERTLRTNFGRDITLDLSSSEKEYANLHFPCDQILNSDAWEQGLHEHRPDRFGAYMTFRKTVLEQFRSYDVPVIELKKDNTKEAVCLVFEKVNTGGKPLDAFELVTAMYAADGHELRKDWYGDEGPNGYQPGRHQRLVNTYRSADSEIGILGKVANTDFLQAISLFHTRERRLQAAQAGKRGKELPAVTANRQGLLNLPLSAYLKYEQPVEEGFRRAAKFLHMLHIYRIGDLPYQSQIVPLAAVLTDIGDAWEHEAIRAQLVRWYWNGVFGELYGTSPDTRIARDFMEVPGWLQGGPEPSTVSETIFRPDRLKTMRTRLSAAYKGMNALLMKEGAEDFRSGQCFDHTVFFGENVDIHHIFPQDWCKKQGIPPAVFDSIINKTPLSFRTNRIIGGVAPSDYLAKLERGDASTPAIAPERLDRYLTSHLIDPSLLRSNQFEAFMEDRQRRLLALIEAAMGKAAYQGATGEEGTDAGSDDEAGEAEMTLGEAHTA
ncbi:MAG: DUF262 domain-containing protein [Gammaproteobacteria bacterium]|nr:DUF262 domain-containing protein [Gammaproteobacteria bacterium]